MDLNQSIWNTRILDVPRAFQETWYLKINDPVTHQALWIRFSLLSSTNGFRRVAETWAVFSWRDEGGIEAKNAVFKQTYPFHEFKKIENSGIQIGNSSFKDRSTRGEICSKGNTIRWDLNIIQGGPNHFPMLPKSLKKAKIVKNLITTAYEDLLVSGLTHINDKEVKWSNAAGMQGHIYGPRKDHSWIWGHCNTFIDEKSQPVHFLFEGLTSRPQIGPFVVPPISTFFFLYQGKSFYFNKLRDMIHIKSKNTPTEWEFQAERDEISFRGFVKAKHKDFVGLTYEDTSGSLLYSTYSNLSDMKILVYRRGKLEATFMSNGTTTLEIVSRDKNPYVPIVV